MNRCNRPCTAFTLIELLVVIGILAILATFILSGISHVQEAARATATKQRIEQVHAQIAMRGQEQTNTAYYLMANLPLGGTLRFERKAGESWASPEGSAAWHRVYPDATAVDPMILGYPWGKERYYHIRESWYTSAFDPPLAVNDPNTWTDAERAAWLAPEEHDITELYPRLSAQFLVLLGVADSVADYRDDRSPKRAFNDAWGNPLVVACALFQPPQYEPPNTPFWTTGQYYDLGQWVKHTVGGKERRYICIRKHDPSPPPPDPPDPSTVDNQPGSAAGVAYWLEALQKKDFYLDQALEKYQYNRAVYVTVGAPGSGLDPIRFPDELPPGQDAAAWNTHLDRLWSQICQVTMPTEADTWDETSVNTSPWEGGITSRRASLNGLSIKSFLSTPIEYK